MSHRVRSVFSILCFCILFLLFVLVPKKASAESTHFKRSNHLTQRSHQVRSQRVVHTEKKAPFSRFSVGSGIAVLEGLDGGRFGYGGNVGFAFRISPENPVYLGMDIGYNRWMVDVDQNQNGTNFSSTESLSSLQVLATIYYRFMEEHETKAHPYVGISVGPNILSGDERIVIGGKQLEGGNEVALQLLFRPGVEFELSESIGINFEPRIGLLEGSFLFIPQVNAIFSF